MRLYVCTILLVLVWPSLALAFDLDPFLVAGFEFVENLQSINVWKREPKKEFESPLSNDKGIEVDHLLPTKAKDFTPSSTSTPIQEATPIRFTLRSGQTHRYELSGIPSNQNKTLFVTLNVCGEPSADDGTPLDGADLQLQVASSNQSGSPMLGTQALSGFANVTVKSMNSSVAYADITAPNISNIHGQWTYEVGISTQGPIHGATLDPNLYLVDTDFANALFVTGNFSKFTNGSLPNVHAYGLYIYNRDSQFAQRLGNSYCAISTGPALLNTHNANVSTTNRGFGEIEKGQFYVRALNKSTDYVAFLTEPNYGIEGGLSFKPVNFTTKTGTNCQVIYDLEFCSGVAYAAPGNASSFTEVQLRNFYDDMAKERYVNFSKSLDNVACNASMEKRYSPQSNCDDCAEAYKNWLCAITIPRCTDWTKEASYLLERPANTSRNPIINEMVRPGRYKEILPCSDLCYKIVQTCDSQFGFKCPTDEKWLSLSYGEHSDNGDVSCSYPGAIYYESKALRLVPSLALVALTSLAVFL